MAMQSQSYVPIAKTDDFLDQSSSVYYAPTMPKIKITCCAQFAVTPDTIRQRPREDYIAFRQWILDTALTDAKSGGVWEYLWHIVFGEMAET